MTVPTFINRIKVKTKYYKFRNYKTQMFFLKIQNFSMDTYNLWNYCLEYYLNEKVWSFKLDDLLMKRKLWFDENSKNSFLRSLRKATRLFDIDLNKKEISINIRVIFYDY